MEKILEQKYSYLSNFFKTAIEQGRLFHSVILYGSNNLIQYAIAMEIARRLNCLEDGRDDCECQNCRWIRENKHPAVITISKIDNKTDSSKTVISEEQINTMLDTLVNSSDYHRVFILCDAQIKELSEEENKEYIEFNKTGFTPPQVFEDSKFWYPSGINIQCFSAVASNAMLKSIEEPPNRVTFIFLTNNKDDLLSTIVSRSQSFYVPDTKIITYNIDFLKKFFNTYPVFSKEKALEFSQTLYLYQTQKNLEPKYIIDSIQYYLLEILKQNSSLPINGLIQRDIRKLEECKKMLDAYIKEQSVYENLAFYFAQR